MGLFPELCSLRQFVNEEFHACFPVRLELPSDGFQARFYNGMSDAFGLYLLEEHLERGTPNVSPRLVQAEVETILVYPRSASHTVVRDKFVPDRRMIKEVWKAKQLGLKGLLPETDCGNRCVHHRLKLTLPEGNIEPAARLPLIFSEGLVDSGYDLDMNYQTHYARKLLPHGIRWAVLLGRLETTALSRWKEWLVKSVGLASEAADIALDSDRGRAFDRSQPSADTLLKSIRGELKPWQQLHKTRIKEAAPFLMGKATSIYALPKASARFVRDSWNTWQREREGAPLSTGQLMFLLMDLRAP